MANSKAIKNRIKSVKSTKKITKAMELVSASKMKKAVASAVSSRLYASYSWELLQSLSTRLEDISHPFFTESKPTGKDKVLLVLVTSNRGLCGAYNAQVIRKTIKMISEATGNTDFDIVAIGKKGDNAMRRTGQNITASFLEVPETAHLSDVMPISAYIVNKYKDKEYNHIYVAYTDFVSALTQKANIRKLLPISKQELKELIDEVEEIDHSKKKEEVATDVPYIFEGDTSLLIESLAEKLVRMQIYQMILESQASEQSARMMAMKNASEAAGEMIDDLTLSFNKARQAGITREISEISAGMASVN